MSTKQTPISLLSHEQLRLLGILIEQDFDLFNFAHAASIELANALAFIGNSRILEAIDFLKDFELARLAHNAARARASTVLLLNRFIHRHDSYDPDHLKDDAPVSPHARLVTNAASTLARMSDLKLTNKDASRASKPPIAVSTPSSKQAAATTSTAKPALQYPITATTIPFTQLNLDEITDPLEVFYKLQKRLQTTDGRVRKLKKHPPLPVTSTLKPPSNSTSTPPKNLTITTNTPV